MATLGASTLFFHPKKNIERDSPSFRKHILYSKTGIKPNGEQYFFNYFELPVSPPLSYDGSVVDIYVQIISMSFFKTHVDGKMNRFFFRGRVVAIFLRLWSLQLTLNDYVVKNVS